MTDSTDCFKLPTERRTLDNGLRVILHADDMLPLTSVHVCYHVGSKNEDPNLTGLAHLFEHLMFEGSQQHDDDYFKPLQEAGASVNGTTGHDLTNYFEVVPANFLERALWLEADRMARLLPVLNEAKLENQRSVVKNERLQRIDNQPYGSVSEEIYKHLYPPGHPYHWPIIGWMEHLDAITLSDVHAFFRRYYAPNNAVLVISGQFERDDVWKGVDRHFASIPQGESVAEIAPRSLAGSAPSRVYHRESVALGRLDMIWPGTIRCHADEPALDIASQILGGGKDSRLRRRLERQDQLAHSVDAYHATMKLAGHLGIRVYALPGASLEQIEAVATEVLHDFLGQPPTQDEVTRAFRHFANRSYGRVETVLSKSDLLHQTLYYQGDLSEAALMDEIERYRAVTPEDVWNAARTYFSQAPKVVVAVEPSSSSTRSLATGSSTEPPTKSRQQVNHALIPGPGPDPTFRMPIAESFQVGPLRVVVVPSRRLPRIVGQWTLESAAVSEPDGQWGIARLTADCMEEGTRRYDSLALARQLELLGAGLSVASGIESTSLSFRTLRSTLNDTMQLLADVWSSPAFAPQDVDRERRRLLAELAHRQKQPRSMADDAIEASVFGSTHPYGRPSDGQPAMLEALTPASLADFHRRYYQPAWAQLLVVGDVSTDQMAKITNRLLTQWPEAALQAPPITPELEADRPTVAIIDRPEAKQSILRVAKRAEPRDTPDYFAMTLLNMIVGGQFSSRLNAKLREDRGFTYGVNSSFVLRRCGGSFLAGGDVDSRVTFEAMRCLIEELVATSSSRPITQKELDHAKSYITRRFPARFETQNGILSHLSHVVVYRLPLDYYDSYLERINQTTLDEVQACALKYLGPRGWHAVVVGRQAESDGLREWMDQLTHHESG